MKTFSELRNGAVLYSRSKNKIVYVEEYGNGCKAFVPIGYHQEDMFPEEEDPRDWEVVDPKDTMQLIAKVNRYKNWERIGIQLNAEPGHCIPSDVVEEFHTLCPDLMEVIEMRQFNTELLRYDCIHLHYEWTEGI